MGVIYGQITDKNNQPLAEVMLGVMNKDFEPMHYTTTEADGTYHLELPDDDYPFFMAVKEYKEKYLEYWCNNVRVQGNLELNCQIDTLEVYGINAFEVKGAAPAVLTVYFRPMSLEKALKKEQDIAPEITEDTLTFLVNGEKSDLLVMNKVKEYTSDGLITAYLVQITRPVKLEERNKLDIILRDIQGNLGMGSLFFEH